MRIYTRTGDDGETGLFDGSRVPKEDLRVAAYGTCDELNASIGVLRSLGPDASSDAELAEIQCDLFSVGSTLATPGGNSPTSEIAARSVALEAWMDRMDEQLPRLRDFILPGGTPLAAQAHVARTVARRAERATWTCARQHEVPRDLLVYLNRLSDALFVYARFANASAGTEDVKWSPPGRAGS